MLCVTPSPGGKDSPAADPPDSADVGPRTVVIAAKPVDHAAVQAPPRGSYRRRGAKAFAPSPPAATPQAAIITEAAAVRRIVRRLILQGNLPTTSPHSGLTVAQFNAKARAELAAPSSPYSWSSTGRAA